MSIFFRIVIRLVDNPLGMWIFGRLLRALKGPQIVDFIERQIGRLVKKLGRSS